MASPFDHVLRLPGAQPEDLALAIASEFVPVDPAAAHERLDELALGIAADRPAARGRTRARPGSGSRLPPGRRLRATLGTRRAAAGPGAHASARPSAGARDHLRGRRPEAGVRAGDGRDRPPRDPGRPLEHAHGRLRPQRADAPAAVGDPLALSARRRRDDARGARDPLFRARRSPDRRSTRSSSPWPCRWAPRCAPACRLGSRVCGPGSTEPSAQLTRGPAERRADLRVPRVIGSNGLAIAPCASSSLEALGVERLRLRGQEQGRAASPAASARGSGPGSRGRRGRASSRRVGPRRAARLRASSVAARPPVATRTSHPATDSRLIRATSRMSASSSTISTRAAHATASVVASPGACSGQQRHCAPGELVRLDEPLVACRLGPSCSCSRSARSGP